MVKVVVSRGASPRGRLRITGTIESAEGTRPVWFDVPEAFANDVTSSGDPWLVLLLPYAVQTGEAIELDLPVDPMLLDNARQLVRTWVDWYPELERPRIDAPTARAAPPDSRTAQFFSGGVDAWFTLLRHAESTPRFPQVGEVDDLLTIHGLDIPLTRHDEFAHLERCTAGIAQHYGKQHVVVATNLRTDMRGAWKDAWGPRWGSLSHGAALAAVGLLLQRRYARMLIGSTGLGTLPPWGSHPLTDALFSTSQTAFHHYHSVFARAEKLERIAQSPYAVSHLKVCFAHGRFDNCSVCAKCHRTLLCLDLLGALDHAASFDVAAYLRNRERPLLVWSEVDRALAQGIRDLALQKGRPEVAALVERSIERSRRVRALSQALHKLSWRVGQTAYRSLSEGMIGA